jgi:tetratricopeptide (TPR) repeat protein
MGGGDRISASLVTADSSFWPLIDGLSLATYTGDPPRYHMIKAEAAMFRGDRAAQFAQGDSARAMLLERMRGGADEPRMLPVLGLAYAHMGRYADAIEAAERGARTIPVSRDAVSGPYFQTNLALIYMYAGKPDRALEALEPLLRIPTWVTPAELRSDPIWEPLRTHARFRRLAGLTP